MWATLAFACKGASLVRRTPWACKKPHLSSSSMALRARVQRLENSAHEVATMAIRIGDEASNPFDAAWRVLDNRMPFGSSSKVAPLKFRLPSVALSSSMLEEERSNIPPSMAFNSSCVMLGRASSSKIDGASVEMEGVLSASA